MEILSSVGLLASLGTTGALIGFLFWQARRAASAADHSLAATKVACDLELQLAARGRAVEDRDRTIDALKAEKTRLEAALAEAISQRDQLVANMDPKDSEAAVDAINDALSSPTRRR